MSRHSFTANKISNLDGTGNSTLHVSPEIICAKVIKQVGSVMSGERGINVTMIVAVNAFGNLVPPMLIFLRAHFKNHMLTGAPTASFAGAHSTGWSDQKLFGDYLKHFFARERLCKEDLVLLILDNRESHLSILDFR
jgi:hypothetical protein